MGKLTRLMKNARLKYGQATLEDLDSRAGRGVERSQIMSLALGEWVSAGHCILITGPTGVGKCGWLRIRHGSGAFGKWLIQPAKTDVVVLDDWGMGAIDSMTRSDLLEVIDDRAARKATIITSQLPIEHWCRIHASICLLPANQTTPFRLHSLTAYPSHDCSGPTTYRRCSTWASR